MVNQSIVACGQKVEIGCRVILWDEPEGYSFYKSNKFLARNLDLESLKKQIKLFVLHHSVTYTAKACYNGLNGRKLSVNFIIDDDNVDGYATIYQCLDIKDAGYSHAPLNSSGPGVEICYHPTAWLTPNAYSEENIKKHGVQPHQKVKDKIHKVTLDVFAPTEAQIRSCTALLKGFCLLFPDINPEFPKDITGNVFKTVVIDQKNLLAHFHITTNKVDPMGFPFEAVEKQLKSELGIKLRLTTRVFHSLKKLFKPTQ